MYVGKYTQILKGADFMTVSAIIKDLLTEKKIKQADFAAAVGISKQNLNNKLSRDNFTSQELYMIAKALKVDIVLKDENGKEYKIQYTDQQLKDFEEKRQTLTKKLKEKTVNE